MIFPKDKGFKHEAYGAGDIQALLKAQEVRDQKHDEEELEEIITDLNELSVKYGGIGTATTYSEAMENLEKTIQEQTSTLVEKSITENGTYNAADDDADGYSSVMVNIPPQSENNAKFIQNPQSPRFDVENTELEYIEIPNGVSSILTGGLRNCPYLKTVVIPSSIESLDSSQFYGSWRLEKIIINKPEGSIPNAPWGAPDTCQIIWAG